jgi:hypothetical protein
MPDHLFSGASFLLFALAVLVLVMATEHLALVIERIVHRAHRRRIERCEEVRTDVDFARFAREQKLYADRIDSIRNTLITLLPILAPALIAYLGRTPFTAEVPGAAPDSDEGKIDDLLKRAAADHASSGARRVELPKDRPPGSKDVGTPPQQAPGRVHGGTGT